MQDRTNIFVGAHIAPMGPVSSICMVRALSFGVYTPELEKNEDSRVRRWRLRWVVRVNFAGQCGQSFVWGRTGILPLCERILDTAPSFLYSMTVRACGTVTEETVGSA